MLCDRKLKFNKGKFKETTKETRAKELHQVICPRCKYHNELYFVKRYGTCHLCRATLTKDYFKNKLIKEMMKVERKAS